MYSEKFEKKKNNCITSVVSIRKAFEANGYKSDYILKFQPTQTIRKSSSVIGLKNKTK